MWDGSRFYLTRIESGLTQMSLAELLGIDVADIYLAERETPPEQVRKAIEAWMAEQ